MNGPDAVKTAGDRLSAIEAWSRRTCYAAIVGAGCLTVMAAYATYAAYVYVRAVVALGQLSRDWNKSTAKLDKEFAKIRDDGRDRDRKAWQADWDRERQERAAEWDLNEKRKAELVEEVKGLTADMAAEMARLRAARR
jgi:hypothetical protein